MVSEIYNSLGIFLIKPTNINLNFICSHLIPSEFEKQSIRRSFRILNGQEHFYTKYSHNHAHARTHAHNTCTHPGLHILYAYEN